MLFYEEKAIVTGVNGTEPSTIVLSMPKDRSFKFGNWGCSVLSILNHAVK